jgi:glycosidase
MECEMTKRQLPKRLFIGVVAILSLAASLLPSNAAVIGTLDSVTANALAQESMPRPVNANDSTYFVFTDRYANGNEDNDGGSGRNQQGFDPANVAYYHGGDFIGLKDNLDRISRLGFNSIWITPPVLNDFRGYHGYWGLDFTTVDPHLGTEQEFQDFVDRAHELGIKVIMDIVLNHTADVIGYSDTDSNFFHTPSSYPYKDAGGTEFNLTEKAQFSTSCTVLGQSNCFPIMSADVSYPREPFISSESKNAKRLPDFLQDINSYHNRGDASSCGWAAGPCAMQGDFFGLDDIMTENPVVVQGLSDVYASWVTRFGIDGFRIDTAKHVNKEFFDAWIPAVNEAGDQAGKGQLTIYGEAWITTAPELSRMIRKYQMQSLIDFPMQLTVTRFAAGYKTGTMLRSAFGYDDYYNTGSQNDIVRNAYGLTTFLGNHDMGRGTSQVDAWTQETGTKLLNRVKLADSILFLMRGAPVIYYGDELGILSTGSNEYARQDMFPTEIGPWKTMRRIGADPIGNGSYLTPDAENHPLSVHIRALNAFRVANPGFVSGAAIARYGDTSVSAWSRIDASDNHEYLVVVNNGKTAKTVSIPVSTKSSNFVGVFGSTQTFRSNTKSVVKVTIPARKAIVIKAAKTLTIPTAAPVLTLKVKSDTTAYAPTLVASTTTKTPLVVTFLARATENDEWQVIGTDDSPMYRFVLDSWVWDGNETMQFAVIARTYDGKIAGGKVISVNYSDVSLD